MSKRNLSVPYTLGLDLGPSSIGWAVVDEEGKQILAMGVRVFPEGLDRNQQGGELPKNEQRRIARGIRRQTARRARRKRLLRQALVQVGLLPEVARLKADDSRRIAWEREQVQQEDPYSLRRRALTERLEPYEVGRALMHLNQRRGFLSNLKTDRVKKKEDSEMLEEISALQTKLGKRTLGEYLAELRNSDPHERLRGRHTRRDMYEREFEAIWTAQQKHHPTLLTEQLKYGSVGKQTYPCEPGLPNSIGPLERFGLHGIIFFQRPMYWPKSVIGQCELEPKQRRCLRADRLAQRCRLLQEVNNLRLLDTSSAEERPLTSDERDLLIRFLERRKEAKFDEIRREFCRKLSVPETIRFNLERGERNKLLGMPTDVLLAHKDLFGKSWYERSDEERDRIVRILLDEHDERRILRLATSEWGLDERAAEKLLKTDLEGKESKGYASFSRSAMEKLRPHLERGLPLMTRDDTPSALSEAGYLRPDQRIVNQKDFLPQPPSITNPLVRQALYEVRRLVNAIIREYGRPARIHIELAREVKGTALDRARRSHEMRQREQRRDAAAEEIRKMGIKVTRDSIDRYLLWEEQRNECVYSGRIISQAQLFGGDIDVDHILPRERSLDNSLMNRVVCFRSENADKKDRTPWEWLAEIDPDKYEAVLQRTKSLPYPKAQRFRQQHVELEDFFARQFVDTTYITTQVHQYVRCLGADVLCSKGMHTAELRQHWGLNTVLRDDGLDLKNREDHRHHAVDAIVIALNNRSRLQQLSKLYRHGSKGEVLADPWSGFRAAVEQAVNGINVSHRVQHKVRGALHEETIYGPTEKPWRKREGERPWAEDWTEEDGTYVRRKPITELKSTKHLSKIRDKTIRTILEAHVRAHGIDPESDKAIPATVWKDVPHMPSGIPIRRVRMLEESETFRPLHERAFVKPGKNHHIVYHQDKADPSASWSADVMTLWEAAQRLRQGKRLFNRSDNPGKVFIMSLAIGEAFLIAEGERTRLCVVRKIDQRSKRIHYKLHTDARVAGEIDKQNLYASPKKMKELGARKVTVDSLGCLRWAND